MFAPKVHLWPVIPLGLAATACLYVWTGEIRVAFLSPDAGLGFGLVLTGMCLGWILAYVWDAAERYRDERIMSDPRRRLILEIRMCNADQLRTLRALYNIVDDGPTEADADGEYVQIGDGGVLKSTIREIDEKRNGLILQAENRSPATFRAAYDVLQNAHIIEGGAGRGPRKPRIKPEKWQEYQAIVARCQLRQIN